MRVNRKDFGKYATDVFTDETVKVIMGHNNTSSPLFMYLAHLAVHSGNKYEPLQAPKEIVDKFAHIEDEARRKYAAMVYKLDQSVGRVVDALARLVLYCIFILESQYTLGLQLGEERSAFDVEAHHRTSPPLQ